MFGSLVPKLFVDSKSIHTVRGSTGSFSLYVPGVPSPLRRLMPWSLETCRCWRVVKVPPPLGNLHQRFHRTKKKLGRAEHWTCGRCFREKSNQKMVGKCSCWSYVWCRSPFWESDCDVSAHYLKKGSALFFLGGGGFSANRLPLQIVIRW